MFLGTENLNYDPELEEELLKLEKETLAQESPSPTGKLAAQLTKLQMLTPPSKLPQPSFDTPKLSKEEEDEEIKRIEEELLAN